MREMLAPGVWSDNVPSSAIARPGTYRTLGGSIVTPRKAPSGLHVPTAAATARRKRDICGYPMRGQKWKAKTPPPTPPCARYPGHKNERRTTHALDLAATRRHA